MQVRGRDRPLPEHEEGVHAAVGAQIVIPEEVHPPSADPLAIRRTKLLQSITAPLSLGFGYLDVGRTNLGRLGLRYFEILTKCKFKILSAQKADRDPGIPERPGFRISHC